MRKRLPFSALLLSLFAFAACAQSQREQGITIFGSLQDDINAVETFDHSRPLRDQVDFAGSNLLTLNAQNTKTSLVKFDASADLWLLLGAYADAVKRADPSLALAVIPSPSAVAVLDVRKLYAALFLPFADVFVGRQIISFGEGMVFSPVDVFSSVNIIDLSLRRRGSDVVRVRVPFGDLAGVDAVAKVNSRADGVAGAIKGYGHVGSFDLGGVGIYQGANKEYVTGLMFRGDLVAGVYGELVEHWREGGYRAFIGMLGADYSIGDNWYFDAEYLYNERPQPTAGPAQFSLLQTNVTLSHLHYGFALVRFKINDLMNISASAIADITAKSGIVTGQYSYNILQNADLVVYLQGLPAAANGLLPVPYAEMIYGVRIKVSF